MDNVNDYLKTSITRIEQIKNQKKSKERRERDAKRKKDFFRSFIIGDLVCKHFPEMLRYQPYWNKADIEAEFADFADILGWLSGNTELLATIKEEASKLAT